MQMNSMEDGGARKFSICSISCRIQRLFSSFYVPLCHLYFTISSNDDCADENRQNTTHIDIEMEKPTHFFVPHCKMHGVDDCDAIANTSPM